MISPDFAPLPALLGGVLIGVAASLYLLTHGKVAGISGIYCAVFDKNADDRSDRIAFVVGLAVAGLAARMMVPGGFDLPRFGLPAIAVAGLLVGYGTRLGNGCTSGHGVCGISRLSVRSIVATIVFVGTGVLTVTAARMIVARMGGAS